MLRPYQIVRGDIWDFVGKVDAICIPTNCHYKIHSNDPRVRLATMGAGLALQAKRRYPGIDRELGGLLVSDSEYKPIIIHEDPVLVAFPVKPKDGTVMSSEDLCDTRYYRERYCVGAWAPGYAFKADMKIMEEAARGLRAMIKDKGWVRVAIPAIGCGKGGLRWIDVKKAIFDNSELLNIEQITVVLDKEN